MIRRRRALLWLIIPASAAAFYATRERWLPAVGRWLDVGEPPIRADYAFVAAGDAQTRPYAAALLYKHGYARKILLTRPLRHAGSAQRTLEFDELARAVLEHEGVKPADLEVLAGDVASTMDEARLLAPRVRAEPQAQFMLVTSDYHTRRLLWSCRREMPEARMRLHAFSAPLEETSAENWWRTESGPTTYVMEYLRLGFYYVRYGRTLQLVASIAAILGFCYAVRRYLLRDFLVRRGGGDGRNSATSVR